MSASILKIFIFLISFFAASLAAAGPSCAPFKVHLGVTALPVPPQIITPEPLPKNWENLLTDKISKIKTQNDFKKDYQLWLKKHPAELTAPERYQWLSCLFYYANIDTDHNGIPDWSALVDHAPATTLFPQDPDQDGDGLINVLDPEPLTPQKNSASSAEIPSHLKIKRPETSALQDELYREFHIIAIDHTDQHSPVVLRELLYLLQKSFSKDFVLSLNIKYIYAFSGHDPSRNIAAYHWQAQALSLGGLQSYPGELISPEARIDLLAALAHEIGHAVLFKKLNAKALAELSHKFSDWPGIAESEMQDSLFSPVFFQALDKKQTRNVVSQYAQSNRHEWFAESFAASTLQNLGLSGALGKNWRTYLVKNKINSPQYWVDYTQISKDFCQWFNLLIKARTAAPHGSQASLF